MGKQTFQGFKPFFVKSMKEQNTCYCIYHVELDELQLGLNNLRVKFEPHHSGECECRCSYVCFHASHFGCGASSKVFESITKMWQLIVCEKGEEEEWHKKKNLYCQCGECGVENFPFRLEEVNSSSEALVEWKRFTMETTMTRSGKTLEKLTLVYKKTNSDEFVHYLKPKLQTFIRHNFVSRWQDKQFKSNIKSFPHQIVVSVVDFDENYTFETRMKFNLCIGIVIRLAYQCT